MNRRDKLGLAVAFLLGVLLGGLGTVTMVLRECWQSRRYGFPVEVDDVVRYSIASSAGTLVNVLLLILILT